MQALSVLRNYLLALVATFVAMAQNVIKPVSLVMADQRGEMTDKVVGLVIALVIISAVVGTAITSLSSTNTSGWGAGAVALWGIIGTVFVAGIVYLIWKSVKE